MRANVERSTDWIIKCSTNNVVYEATVKSQIMIYIGSSERWWKKNH